MLPETKKEFTEAVEAGMTLAEACKYVGVSRMTIWRARQADPAFDERLRMIMDEQDFAVEAVMLRNALDPDPAHNATRMFWLKCRVPEIYRDHRDVSLTTPDGISVNHSHKHAGRIDIDAQAVIGVLRDAGLLVARNDDGASGSRALQPGDTDAAAIGVSDD